MVGIVGIGQKKNLLTVNDCSVIVHERQVRNEVADKVSAGEVQLPL